MVPEFPFSFSMVIMFVAVTAVYLVIRQKMTQTLSAFSYKEKFLK